MTVLLHTRSSWEINNAHAGPAKGFNIVVCSMTEVHKRLEPCITTDSALARPIITSNPRVGAIVPECIMQEISHNRQGAQGKKRFKGALTSQATCELRKPSNLYVSSSSSPRATDGPLRL